jgi:drug/metabolite transporter (DMT)-like permease
VRFSNRELPPVFGAGLRFALAAVLLILVVRLRRIPLPRGRALTVSLVYGVLSFTCSYALAYWALQELSAGIGAVLFAATPLVTVFLAPLHNLERFRMRGLVGSLVVLAGIAILANPAEGGEAPIVPILAMLGATVTAAEAAVLVKKYPTGNPLATNAVAMGIGSVVLLAISRLAGEAWTAPPSTTTWFVVVYLAVIGSAGLFGLFLFTLSRWTASATSYFTALMPVVSMIAGSVLASEAITIPGAVGGLIVLLGVYLGALSNPKRVSTTPSPAASN